MDARGGLLPPALGSHLLRFAPQPKEPLRFLITHVREIGVDPHQPSPSSPLPRPPPPFFPFFSPLLPLPAPPPAPEQLRHFGRDEPRRPLRAPRPRPQPLRAPLLAALRARRRLAQGHRTQALGAVGGRGRGGGRPTPPRPWRGPAAALRARRRLAQGHRCAQASAALKGRGGEGGGGA